MRSEIKRLDHRVIAGIIENGSRVLDLGCGDGDLMFILAKEKQANVQGIELDESEIYKCVAKGLSVFHGDIDSGLKEYPDKSFDYVILNQSLQQVKHVDTVFDDALRAGRKVIVGIPNFANYKSRIQLFFGGKAPVTNALPYAWHETPNLRSLSISDFIEYCRKKKAMIEKVVYLGENNRVVVFPNLFASTAIFLISRKANF